MVIPIANFVTVKSNSLIIESLAQYAKATLA